MKRFIALFLLLAVAALCQSLPTARGTERSNSIVTVTVTIADGESLSAASTNLQGYVLVGVMVPAEWTTAALSFQGSVDGTTWVNVYDDSGEYSTAAMAASGGCSVVKDVFRPWKLLKARAGTASSAVAQAGGDVVTLILETR